MRLRTAAKTVWVTTVVCFVMWKERKQARREARKEARQWDGH